MISNMLCLRCTEKRLNINYRVDESGESVPPDSKNDKIAETEKRFSVIDKDSPVKCNVCSDCGCRIYFL